MRLVIPSNNPAIIRLIDFQDKFNLISSYLSYTDEKKAFEVKKLKKQMYYYNNPKLQNRIDTLEKEIKQTLLKQDKDGYYTYSGLSNWLSKKTGIEVENQIVYPEPKIIPWDNKPIHPARYYQTDMVEGLIKNKHAGVESATGTGKSRVIVEVFKKIALKTLIVTPSTSISQQLYNEFVRCFGKKYIGKYYGSKKEPKKLVVIANAQSITRLEKSDPDWKTLSETEVLMFDESHTTPAETFKSVCFGVAAKAPYRFFLSATQMRNDGLDVLLDGITGPMVYKYPIQKAIEEGYLAKPLFKIFKIPKYTFSEPDDPNANTRQNLYYNPKVVEVVGNLVNHAVLVEKLPTLILIKEVEQFTKLLPYLKVPALFAHGTGDNKDKIPPEYWESNPNELVEKFNKKECPLLIGTSCISTGTDIKAVKFLVYWQGGKSEIQVKQAIGRSTRLDEGKTTCHIVDFDIFDSKVLHNHARIRKEYYSEIGTTIKEIEV